MTISRPAAVLALLLAGCAAPADPPPVDALVPAAPAGSAAMGGVLVRTQCAGCHAVGRTDDSPLKAAPPFRDLGALYPASDLQEAFAEGVVTAHPAMPEFEFTPQQIADLIAYLESVSGPGSVSPSGPADA